MGKATMFERFTEKAIKVIMLTQEEARRLGHNFVGTEQILLGLIGESTGVAAKVLKSMGIDLKDARIEVEKIIGRGSGFVAVEIPFTPRAKRVLELSLEEARQLGHNYIGTEHLLLGLIREVEGVAVRVLEQLDVDLADVRNQIIRMLGEDRGFDSNPLDTEDDVWYADGRLLEDEDFRLDPRRSRRRYRLESQDPLETSETNIMLRSILHRTIAIERSVNEIRAEIVALSDRVARIEGKL
jgi:ATP-dependent Clp protease ATP-binding subunit ClpA